MTLSRPAVAPTLRDMTAGDPEESAAAARKRSGGHSGRLLLRMPESLHAELARASQREGVSLNAYIIDALTSAVSRRSGSPRAARADPTPRRRLVERLLIVNAVVVAAVGVLVVVLLVRAL